MILKYSEYRLLTESHRPVLSIKNSYKVNGISYIVNSHDIKEDKDKWYYEQYHIYVKNISDQREVMVGNGGWICANPGPKEDKIAMGISREIFEQIYSANPDMGNILFLKIRPQFPSDPSSFIIVKQLMDEELEKEVGRDINILLRIVHFTPTAQEKFAPQMAGLDFNLF